MPQTLHLKSVNGEVLRIKVKAEPDSIITGNTAVINADNLGGEGLFAQKNGQILEFKGLVAGSNITLTPSATGITISSTGGGGTGTTSGVTYAEFIQYTGVTAPNTFVFKNVFNTYSGTTIPSLLALKVDKSVFNTYTGTTVPGLLNLKVDKTLFNSYTGTTHTRITSIETDYVTGGTSLGGNAIFVDKNNHRLRFKGLVQGNGITLTPSSTGITITANVTGITGYVTTAEFAAYSGTTVPALLNLKVDKTVFNTYTGTTVPALLLLKVDKTIFDTYTGTTAPATYALKTNFNTFTGTTAPATYETKSHFNTYTGNTAPVITAAVTGGTNVGSLGEGVFYQKNGRNLEFKKIRVSAPLTVSGSTSQVHVRYTGSTYSPDATIVSLSSTTTIDATYAGKIIECTGTFTLTLPNSMATGMQVTIINVGTGVITIAASTTLQTRSSYTKLNNQYGGCTAYHRGSNVWLAAGDLSF